MHLTVTKGSQVVQTLELLPATDVSALSDIHYFIGRSQECHVVIKGHNISRNHAQLSFVNGAWKVEKMAQNGKVLLNGRPIDQASVKHGDIIEIAEYCINMVLEPRTNQMASNAEPGEERDSAPEGASASGAINSSEEESEAQTLAVKNVENGGGQEAEVEELVVDVGDGEGDNAQGEEAALVTEGLDFEQVSAEQEEGVAQTEESQGEVSSEAFAEGEIDAQDSSFDDDLAGADEDGLSAPLDAEEEETKIVRSFVEFELNISGEYTNFDKFYINKDEVFIGRDPNKCQIVLDDPESSQVHAVIRRKGTYCEIEDLGSTNGVVLNGLRINQDRLNNGDEFLIGNTSFRLAVKSELISEEKSILMPVEKIQEVNVEEVVEKEVDMFAEEAGTQMPQGGSGQLGDSAHESNSIFSKAALKDPAKRKKLLIYAVVGLGLWVILGEDQKGKKTALKQAQAKKDRRLIKDTKQKKNAGNNVNNKRSYENLPPGLQEYIRTNYELAKSDILEYGKFEQGLQYLDKMDEYVDEFEQSKSLEITAKEELKKLEDIERRKKEKQEIEEKKIRVGNLLEKADEAMGKEQAELVQSLLNKIFEIDPENIKGAQINLQLKNFVREKERQAIEEAAKKSRRDRLTSKFSVGKTLHLKQEWYQSIVELEQFLSIKDNDDDLVKEAATMLKESQEKLQEKIVPMLKKAQSLNEGQDKKGAYEIYKEVLKIDPANTNIAVNMGEIKDSIERQAKKIYREAIVDESLNYLKQAKEKFQEVQQITPSDSPYHKRAANKLKKYVDY